MSLILAIKHHSHIYLASDSQVSSGRLITPERSHSQTKLMRIGDLCIGGVGSYHSWNYLIHHKSLFNVTKDFVLTKRWLVEEFVHNLYDFFNKHKLLEITENKISYFQNYLMIAHGSKLFTINGAGTVIEHEHFAVLGAPHDLALPLLKTYNHQENPKGFLHKVLSYCCEYDDSISPPFIYLDTKSLKHEIWSDES